MFKKSKKFNKTILIFGAIFLISQFYALAKTNEPQNTTNINNTKSDSIESSQIQDPLKLVQNPRPSEPNTAYNGTTAIIISEEENPKDLILNKKNIPWIDHPSIKGRKFALVPINYREKNSEIDLSNEVKIKVLEGKYKKERIIVSDKSKVSPNKTQQERIAKERDEAMKIYAKFTPQRLWSEPFMLPMSSKITSHFGNARVYNDGEVKSFHGGTDFRAVVGTPIYATNDGIVELAKDRFLAGKSVLINHGNGLFTQYYHCSEILVQKGQKVQKGQIIAKSGASGRVSGPHLHFGVLLHGAQVDPLDFINAVNSLF